MVGCALGVGQAAVGERGLRRLEGADGHGLSVAGGTQGGLAVLDIGDRDLGVREGDLIDHIGYGVSEKMGDAPD